jgi:Phasin protein
MSKRTPPTASKRSHRPKIAGKAQRAAQDIVTSPKDSRLRSVEAEPTESVPKRDSDSKNEAHLIENPVTALQHEAPLVVNPATALQDDCNKTLTHNDSKTGFVFSSAPANVWTFQAKLLEMAQANMQFAFEFVQRLATIRSPFEFLSVNAEFTGKRIAMFRKHSKEMAELSTKR